MVHPDMTEPSSFLSFFLSIWSSPNRHSRKHQEIPSSEILMRTHGIVTRLSTYALFGGGDGGIFSAKYKYEYCRAEFLILAGS